MKLAVFFTLMMTTFSVNAGLPGQDPMVDLIRTAMKNGRTPSVDELVNKKWNCTSVEAIEGGEAPSTWDGPKFIIENGQLVHYAPESMFGNLIYTYTGYGWVNLTPHDEKYTWMTVYKKTTDGKLVMEMSLNPKGDYKQSPSVVDPRYFAKSYQICAEKK